MYDMAFIPPTEEEKRLIDQVYKLSKRIVELEETIERLKNKKESNLEEQYGDIPDGNIPCC